MVFDFENRCSTGRCGFGAIRGALYLLGLCLALAAVGLWTTHGLVHHEAEHHAKNCSLCRVAHSVDAPSAPELEVFASPIFEEAVVADSDFVFVTAFNADPFIPRAPPS